MSLKFEILPLKIKKSVIDPHLQLEMGEYVPSRPEI